MGQFEKLFQLSDFLFVVLCGNYPQLFEIGIVKSSRYFITNTRDKAVESSTIRFAAQVCWNSVCNHVSVYDYLRRHCSPFLQMGIDNYTVDFTANTIYSVDNLEENGLTLVLCEGLHLKSGGGFFAENRRIFNFVSNLYSYASAL